MIALSGGELISFELSANGQLMELMKKDMPGDVACLDLLPVPEGRQRAKFLAVGAYDNTVRRPRACMRVRLASHDLLDLLPMLRASPETGHGTSNCTLRHTETCHACFACELKEG